MPLSPPPGVPQTSDKAKIGGAIAGIATAILVAVTAYLTGDNDVDTAGIVSAIVTGLVTALATYGGVFAVPNKATSVADRPIPPFDV